MKLFCYCLAAGLAVVALPAQAGLFVISDRTYGNAPKAEVDQLFDALETQVNSKIPDADPSTYTRGVANSTVLAGAGAGADYVTPFTHGIAGATLGVGADLGHTSISQLASDSSKLSQVAGFGFQGTLYAGVTGDAFTKGKKIGPFDLSRFKGYAGFFKQSYAKDPVSASFTSWSLKGQFKAVTAERLGPLSWGGVDLTSGLQRTSLHVLVTKTLNVSNTSTITAPGNPQVTATFVGTANLGADVTTWNIPIELSTSARVLSLFSVFGGLGADLSLGSSANITNVSGPVSVTDSSGALGQIGGTASLPLDSASGPSFMSLRYFAGAQLELIAVAITAQINGSISNSTIGATAGVKAFW